LGKTWKESPEEVVVAVDVHTPLGGVEVMRVGYRERRPVLSPTGLIRLFRCRPAICIPLRIDIGEHDDVRSIHD
jgi:hypothetical protein